MSKHSYKVHFYAFIKNPSEGYSDSLDVDLDEPINKENIKIVESNIEKSFDGIKMTYRIINWSKYNE